MAGVKEYLNRLEEGFLDIRQLQKYSELPLECDGLTRVLIYVLNQMRVKHSVYVGTILYGGKKMTPHFWIKLQDGRIIDYRARMWLGDQKEIPHGVFSLKKYPDIVYQGKQIPMKTDSLTFNVLVGGMV